MHLEFAAGTHDVECPHCFVQFVVAWGPDSDQGPVSGDHDAECLVCDKMFTVKVKLSVTYTVTT